MGNIYELLGLKIGCDMKDIDAAIKIYEDLGKRYNFKDAERKRSYDKVMEYILSEYEKLKRSKEEYDDGVFKNRNNGIGEPDENTNKQLDNYATEDIVKKGVSAHRNHEKEPEYSDGIKGIYERNAVDNAVQKDKQHQERLKQNERSYKLQKAGKVVIIIAITAGVIAGVAHYVHKADGSVIKTSTSTSQEIYQDSEKEKLVIMTYTVVNGDTISGIEERFHGKVDFDGHNNQGISNANQIYPGQEIQVKVSESVRDNYEKQQEELEKENEPVSYEEYKIVEDDTIPKIAEKFNVTPQSIIDANENLKSVNDTIYAGEYLEVPIYKGLSK